MRYACLIHVGPEDFPEATRDEEERFDAINRHYDEALAATNHLVLSGALALPSAARTLRVRGGRPLVTDGPFAETREHIGGMIVIEAASLEEATELLTRSPIAGAAAFEIREMKSLSDPDWGEWAAAAYGRK